MNGHLVEDWHELGEIRLERADGRLTSKAACVARQIDWLGF